MASRFVFDASALLALLFDEVGAGRVLDCLEGAVISAVNMSEVIGKMLDKGMPLEVVRPRLEELSLEVRPFDFEQGCLVASLRARTQPLGLSLADRSCLALGLVSSYPVLTADRAWTNLQLGVAIEVVR